MKIAAITTYKNGTLLLAMQKLGWTTRDLAEKSGTCLSMMYRYVSMKSRPSQDVANAIQRTFAEAGVYVDVLEEWPESFRMDRNKVIQVRDVDQDKLELMAEVPERLMESNEFPEEIKSAIQESLNELPPRHRFVIEERILNGRTLEDIGTELGVSRSQIAQIEAKGLRMLRHPNRLTRIEESIHISR